MWIIAGHPRGPGLAYNLLPEVWDHGIRQLGVDTYLVTYQLNGQGRRTRRATIWRSSPVKGWHVLYHQGTVIAEV